MKKIFLSCLFFIALLIFPHKADALRGRANCSFSPPQIQSGDNSVTFTIGSTQPSKTYEIVVDINKDSLIGKCTIDVVSLPITATSNTVSYTFTPQNEKCFDRLVAVKPDNHNDISLREVNAPLFCTSEYTVASSCRLAYTPRDLSINQTIYIAGVDLPKTATCIGISGPSYKYKNIEISLRDGVFSKTIDNGLPVAGNYQIQVGYSDPASGGQGCNLLSECPSVPIGIGLPGQPVQNPGPPSGGFTPVAPQNFVATCPDGTQGINTAVGCIPIENANTFVGWFLKWAIGIAGGIAFLMLIFSGFQIMTSSNNPQQLQTGRELLTAAVSGLILIVFSAFLLKLIGVDILGIPGL